MKFESQGKLAKLEQEQKGIHQKEFETLQDYSQLMKAGGK